MSDKIEEKLPNYVKIMEISFIILLFLSLLSTIVPLIQPNVDPYYKAFFIIAILFLPPAIIGCGVDLRNSTTILTVENGIITYKLPFQEPVSVSIENIKRIDTWGDVKHGRHYYIITFKNKKITTSSFCFSFKKKKLNIFMDELQKRVDEAKQEK